jgi:hypothetical protein
MCGRSWVECAAKVGGMYGRSWVECAAGVGWNVRQELGGMRRTLTMCDRSWCGRLTRWPTCSAAGPSASACLGATSIAEERLNHAVTSFADSESPDQVGTIVGS